MKRVYIYLCMVVVLTLAGCSWNQATENSSSVSGDGETKYLKVYFIDVGQADAILVNCGEDSMVIDAGNNEDGEKVSSYIKELGINKLDYVIGTHPHEDHIGGLDNIIEDYDIDKVFMADYKEETDTYEDVIEAIKEKDLSITKPVVGKTYSLGEAYFTIIAPNKEDYGDNVNNYSIGIKLQFGKNTFIMVGDAQKEAEEDIISNGIDLKADVLKISHHGGATSTSDEFLHAVDPTYAIISVGKDNTYGHPSSDVITRLQEDDVQIYRTDKQGTIIATSDGKNVSFQCETSVADSLNSRAKKGTAETNEDTVYITNSGIKYHRADCSFLKESKISISLEDAKEEGYKPCSKCNPPE